MEDMRQPVPAALYARVSSDRQDVDLSVSAQLRALREYAGRNGYVIKGEYVDEAKSGLIVHRPQFREMLHEARRPNASFRVILVWKFSRFTRNREHSVALKAMLRRKGVRVVSMTEQADDTPHGRLMEGVIEAIDEYYSANLGQEVLRGMSEAAMRGFWVSPNAPYGYRKVKVSDGGKMRPRLVLEPTASGVVERIFGMVESGKTLLEVTRTLNGEGIASPKGKRWTKNVV